MVMNPGDLIRATGPTSIETRSDSEVLEDLGLTEITEAGQDAAATLQTLGVFSVSAAQWGYLADFQALSTRDRPTFASITITDGGSVLCAVGAGAGLTIVETDDDRLGFFGAEPVCQPTVADPTVSTYTLTDSPASMAALCSDVVTQIQAMETDLGVLAAKYNEITLKLAGEGIVSVKAGMA